MTRAKFGRESDCALTMQERRARCALVIVAVLAAAFLVACGASGTRENASAAFRLGSIGARGSYTQALLDDFSEAPDITPLLEEKGAFAFDPDEAPVWLWDELALPETATIDYATSDWSTLGISVEGDAAEALERVSDSLAEKGWHGLGSGIVGTATFVKEEGTCTWMAVSCSMTTEATTSMVVTMRHS